MWQQSVRSSNSVLITIRVQNLYDIKYDQKLGSCVLNICLSVRLKGLYPYVSICFEVKVADLRQYGIKIKEIDPDWRVKVTSISDLDP